MTKPKSVFSHLNDGELLTETELSAKIKKAATLKLLDYLFEVDLRRLYAHLHCGSLFEYLVKEMEFNEPAASERVAAVRLMRAVPETKPLLENGSLTLTNAAQIQRFIKTEEKAHKEKLSDSTKQSVVHACLNQSKREVEKVLLAKLSEPARVLVSEKTKSVTATSTELKFIVSEDVMMKLTELKNVIGEQSLAQILERGIDLALIQEKKGGILKKPLRKVIVKLKPSRLGNPILPWQGSQVPPLQTLVLFR